MRDGQIAACKNVALHFGGVAGALRLAEKSRFVDFLVTGWSNPSSFIKAGLPCTRNRVR